LEDDEDIEVPSVVLEGELDAGLEVADSRRVPPFSGLPVGPDSRRGGPALGDRDLGAKGQDQTGAKGGGEKGAIR
jgi:hypothetical protein